MPTRYTLHGPRVSGGTYWCAYWHKYYTVLDVEPEGWITCRDFDGKIRRHLTAWDRKDKVVTPGTTRARAEVAGEFHIGVIDLITEHGVTVRIGTDLVTVPENYVRPL